MRYRSLILNKEINVNNFETQPEHTIRQNGSALVIGLLILLVLTIIGTTALNDSMLEEKMAGNFQREVVAFQAAETSMNQIFYRAAQDKNPDGENENITLEAINAGKEVFIAPDNNVFVSKDAQSKGTAKVMYKGSSLPSGGSIGLGKRQFTGEMIEIEATGEVANATVTHTLGAKKNVPIQ